ncbi:unnamed protein product, partial [Polarella glacialis]
MAWNEEASGSRLVGSESWESTSRVVDWVRQHGFQRVALQFPDSLLTIAPEIADRLRRLLPESLVFVLGDSSYGGGGVDEVGAQHYGADCIVRFGLSDQERGGALPVLFVFSSQIKVADTWASAADLVAGAAREHFSQSLAEKSAEEGPIGLLLLCDMSFHDSVDRLVDALWAALASGRSASELRRWQILVAHPRLEASAGEDTPARWRDWRWGTLGLGAGWWAPLGPLTLAAAAQSEPLRVCSRDVRIASVCPGDSRVPCHLPRNCGIVYVGPSAESPLERRLLLRHGQSRAIWRPSRRSSCG